MKPAEQEETLYAQVSTLFSNFELEVVEDCVRLIVENLKYHGVPMQKEGNTNTLRFALMRFIIQSNE